MNEAIGQVLSLAVVVAISPFPIIGVVLMLGTPRAKSNGLAFLAGWVAGLILAGGIVLLVAGGASATEGGAPADWVGYLKLVLGGFLLVLAVKQWRSRPAPGEEAEMPGWMDSVDHFTEPRSAALGVALAAVNPKNLILVVGAAASIAQTGADTTSQVVALAVFVAVASLGPAVPIFIYFAMRERADGILGDLRETMARNNAAIMAVICLVIGVKLIGDAVTAL